MTAEELESLGLDLARLAREHDHHLAYGDPQSIKELQATIRAMVRDGLHD